MRIVIPALALALALPLSAHAQTSTQHSLEKLWETDAVLKFPEEVVIEPGGQFMYVSNTDGAPLEKDGRGSIGKIGMDGKVIEVEWVTGLDAPKGMRQQGDLLYLADLAQVVVVDTTKATIVRRIPVPGATLLHNIVIASDGLLYVSDMFTGKIHAIRGDQVSTYVEQLSAPSGLVLSGTDLYVYTGEGLVKIDAQKNRTVVATGMDRRANGLQMVDGKEFLATNWGGFVYYISADGSHQVLLDTTADRVPGGINLYDPKTRTMYMTTDQHNTVVAYRVR
ncbi:MAG: ATP/GTP-binding protein [Acidobacteria bacterium]|nr:ATP/GTP-binding protein [Acidobacteriota bacterium]